MHNVRIQIQSRDVLHLGYHGVSIVVFLRIATLVLVQDSHRDSNRVL